MNRYQNLGVVAVRWLGVAFLTLSVTSLLIGLAGPWAMGGTMMGGGQAMTGYSEQMMPGGFGHMAGGGFGMWWGPTVLLLLVGVLLVALGRPIGKAIGSGLSEA
ncbi:MAG: hypothetical protein WEA34_11555 [Gemmatimonadota bacterium]